MNGWVVHSLSKRSELDSLFFWHYYLVKGTSGQQVNLLRFKKMMHSCRFFFKKIVCDFLLHPYICFLKIVYDYRLHHTHTHTLLFGKIVCNASHFSPFGIFKLKISKLILPYCLLWYMVPLWQ